jgi:hypothetical protein
MELGLFKKKNAMSRKRIKKGKWRYRSPAKQILMVKGGSFVFNRAE